MYDVFTYDVFMHHVLCMSIYSSSVLFKQRTMYDVFTYDVFMHHEPLYDLFTYDIFMHHEPCMMCLYMMYLCIMNHV